MCKSDLKFSNIMFFFVFSFQPNVQCRKSLKCQGITAHVKACAVDWLKENGQYLNLN